MSLFGKKPKLPDGYILSLPLEDKLLHFYRDPAHRVLADKVLKVDEDKVIAYEDMCETYRENFMELGLLRLHTPLNVHEERLSTNFLYVPPSERARIQRMLGGESLITRSNPSLGYGEYCLVEKDKNRAQTALQKELKELPLGHRVVARGTPEELATLGLPSPFRVIKCFTLDELVGSLEMMKRFDFPDVDDPDSKRHLRTFFFGIPYEEADEQVQVDQGDRFYFCKLGVDGMFIEREKTWLEKIFG